MTFNAAAQNDWPTGATGGKGQPLGGRLRPVRFEVANPFCRGRFGGVKQMPPTPVSNVSPEAGRSPNCFSRKAAAAWLPLLLATLFTVLAATAWAGEKKDARRAEAEALFTNSNVLRLRIDVSRNNANSLRRNPRQAVQAVVREGDTVYSNVWIHLKGHWGSFRDFDDKPGLTLRIDETNTLFHGLKKFHLNNSVQDPTFLSEWLCSQIFDAANVPFPRTAHAVVELNGRRLGMYVIKEGENRDFFARYFKDTRGNLYGQSTFADVNSPLEIINNNEDDATRKDLRRLAQACRETAPDRLQERLPKVLDLPRFLSFMAIEMLLCDWDGYTCKIHNYRVYHNLDNDTAVFIPHDKDQILERPGHALVPKPGEGLVAQAVLRVPEWEQQYQNRLNEIFTNIFKPAELNRRLDEKAAKLAASIESYDPNLAKTLRGNSRSLKSRITQRAQIVQQRLKITENNGPPIVFTDNLAVVTNWYTFHDFEGATLAKVVDDDGKKCLTISAAGKCTASWRAVVTLEPGHYVFEGLARTAGVEATEDPKRGTGAGLRLSASRSPRQNNLAGDTPWRKVAFEFRVAEGTADAVLVCELLATSGQVWFDETSLRLRKIE